MSRASFLTFLFKESPIPTPFQLARGYPSSVAGISASIVPQQFLEDHIELTAARALHKTLREKLIGTIRSELHHKEMQIWVCYDTSKQNDRKHWIEARIIHANRYIVKCSRAQKGPSMTVAYENVCIAPKSEFERL